MCVYVWVCVCMYVCMYNLEGVVEGDQKVPFSIATTLKSRGGHYSFPWNAPLKLDPYHIMLC